jgi:hypothetical protein
MSTRPSPCESMPKRFSFPVHARLARRAFRRDTRTGSGERQRQVGRELGPIPVAGFDDFARIGVKSSSEFIEQEVRFGVTYRFGMFGGAGLR